MAHNLVGMKWKKWTVIELSVKPYKAAGRWWRCVCECGAEQDVLGSILIAGKSQQCRKCSNTRHGGSKDPEYKIWAAMIGRCHNPSDKSFSRYGANGISVCEEWRNSYSAFIADMGRRPSKDHSIDRINNEGSYERLNCRWATSKQQQRNKSNNHRVVVDGESRTLAEWAELKGIRYATLIRRIHFQGWTPEKAITTPIDTRRRRSVAK